MLFVDVRPVFQGMDGCAACQNRVSGAGLQAPLQGKLCLFVCLVHGVPVVCGGRRLTKEGPYATRRQAEAVLFVRRKPTPPFAGCQGNLLFRGSRGLQTGRPVDHCPYSARHVGLLVGSFLEQ